MKLKTAISIALCALAATPVSAMTVQTFLDRADAMRAKGMMAAFSSGFSELRNEGRDAMKSWRGQTATARPPVCPPTKVQRMGVDEFLNLLRALPAVDRATLSLRDGLHRQMNARYRCR